MLRRIASTPVRPIEEGKMKLSTRLVLIVAGTVLGLVILGGFALSSLHSTMLEERKAGIRMTLLLANNMVRNYVAAEKSGKLTREEAQSAAKDALRGLRNGDDYVFVRAGDKLLLSIVHPDPRKEGKESDGGKLPNGMSLTDAYLAALKDSDFAFVSVYTKRPQGNVEVPKISAIQRVPEWGWLMGTGVFIDDIDAAFQRYLIQFALIGGAVLVGVVILAVSLARGIYRAIGGEPAYAAEVARAVAAGDLTRAVEHHGNKDSLLATMADMQGQLKAMIAQITQGAVTLSESGDRLAVQMTQINAAAQRSAEATASTAAAIEEMAVSVAHISDRAKDSEQNSQHSSELAASGEALVHRAADELNVVSRQVADSSARIEGLAERTREIGGIANVIKEIADQTNLLALNAAIEAARAGEQGRGFAVVADEVRKLAERTGTATDQIAAQIQGIQNDTEAVVSGMRTIAPQVAKGVAIANEAAGTLHEINDGASATLENIREVAHSTSEQRIASDSVAANIEKITQMVDEMASSVDVANGNVNALEHLAVELRGSVTRFHV
jgi:methyl-accepting chemotaxis protein/methyl-accepting chemotaxis protein-3 (ribose and galactose sensor receptor)